ncbi:hypothetical protein KVT40_001986 [Elsinoe batatas]|uniref:Small ribosomal subunit protein uS9m n=1 Tax=Elsinoe batatas TaxID=2601811 RepID=A0A8K0L6Z9_9PEZI|nr:hypothetical protein KVT40_001986 [Elsinoe batatas]
MEARTIRVGLQRALQICRPTSLPIRLRPRTYATTTSDSTTPSSLLPNRPFPSFIKAKSTTEPDEEFDEDEAEDPEDAEDAEDAQELAEARLRSYRVVPASPSYFTALPRFTDDLLRLEDLLRKHSVLPVLPPGEQPRVSWLTYQQYTMSNTEPIRKASYAKLLKTLHRLNQIHPAVVPGEVLAELERYKRAVQPSENQAKPLVVDMWGRSRAVGRRKTSHAVVWVVEGEGEVKVNGRSLSEMFGRLHDRESAVWPLKSTGRLGLYNVWAIVRGGGTTGQAEAMTLGLAKALMAHEPGLKPALRRAGCVTRDTREVERKKAGKLKSRKMPAWVKR